MQDQRQAELDHMRLAATLLLVAMTALFVATKVIASDALWVPYLRAFAEAGMVGACADWFAVVALFRHPLGLPIPHTAIVPANKERIADALGRFISTNFLTRCAVNDKLAKLDIAGAVARWLADPQNSSKIAAFCGRALPELVKIVPENRIREVVDEVARRGAQSVPIAPLSAQVLETLWAQGEAQALLDRAIVYAGDALLRNQADIEARVAKKAPRWLPKWIDALLVKRVVAGLIGSLSNMRNPTHPWRRELQKSIETFIATLATDPNMRAEGEAIKARVLSDPVFLRQTDLLWSKIEARLLSDLSTRGDDVAKGIDAALSGLGSWLSNDPSLTAALNRRIRLMALRALPPRRAEIGAYVSEVVRRWDSETFVQKLELSVGRDLQYIRINGTLVGGLVGLLIFALGGWLDGLSAGAR
ncbi:MAG TPA: DUF445 domain-containing protein [Methylocystis sp.]|nr:DUF445 domain-containing protein [Methylocystis sp.]